MPGRLHILCLGHLPLAMFLVLYVDADWREHHVILYVARVVSRLLLSFGAVRL